MLSNSQKRRLKALAHAKKPVVIVGNNGLTPAVLEEIDRALAHHELIKVKIHAEDRAEREQLIERISRQLMAERVQRVGHIATFFRRNTEK